MKHKFITPQLFKGVLRAHDYLIYLIKEETEYFPELQAETGNKKIN